MTTVLPVGTVIVSSRQSSQGPMLWAVEIDGREVHECLAPDTTEMDSDEFLRDYIAKKYAHATITRR